ncbi:MAG: hypothetical protein ACO3ZY_14270, partial [Phycisphaerales bacterium]
MAALCADGAAGLDLHRRRRSRQAQGTLRCRLARGLRTRGGHRRGGGRGRDPPLRRRDVRGRQRCRRQRPASTRPPRAAAARAGRRAYRDRRGRAAKPRGRTHRAHARSVDAAAALAGELRGLEAFAKEAARLDAAIASLEAACRETAAAIEESPPAHLREGGAIKDGFDAELDEARSLHRDGHAWLASYQQRLAGETGIASLKIGFNRVFGYYVEITHAHRDAAIPAEFVRRQTLKNAERYTTPELSAYESKALDAESRALERERRIFESLVERWVGVLAALAEV